jgi:hypothetical protein
VDVFLCPTAALHGDEGGEMSVQIEHGLDEDMLSAIMQFTACRR